MCPILTLTSVDRLHMFNMLYVHDDSENLNSFSAGIYVPHACRRFEDFRSWWINNKKKSHAHTKSRILNYSIKVKIDATLIFKRQPTLQKLLKKQSCCCCCLNKSHLLSHTSFVFFFSFLIIIIIIILFWEGIYHFQVETEIHRLTYGIVIQITLRSNHHYAKLNDINRVCQQKCWSCFFTKIHLLLIHWNVCVRARANIRHGCYKWIYVSVCRSGCHFLFSFL